MDLKALESDEVAYCRDLPNAQDDTIWTHVTKAASVYLNSEVTYGNGV